MPVLQSFISTQTATQHKVNRITVEAKEIEKTHTHTHKTYSSDAFEREKKVFKKKKIFCCAVARPHIHRARGKRVYKRKKENNETEKNSRIECSECAFLLEANYGFSDNIRRHHLKRKSKYHI